MRKLLAAAAVLLAVTAPPASAQTANMTFVNGGSYTDGSYYVGQYHGTMNGAPVTLNCVDFFHEVTNGQVWQANVTGLTSGDLSNTRFGDAGLDAYKQAAFLTSYYSSVGGDAGSVTALQHAIWSFYPNMPGTLPAYIQTDLSHNATVHDAGYWVAFANSNYALRGDDFYSQFAVVTDVRVSDPQFVQSRTTQEFLTTTPEPSSMALLGTGLVGLLPMVRRRKKS